MAENAQRTCEMKVMGLSELRSTAEVPSDNGLKSARLKNSFENLPDPEKRKVVVRIIDTVKDL